jgi:hypothetical protein
VRLRRQISKRIRRAAEGINLAADINADVSVNTSERRSSSPPPAGDGRKPRERRKETP